ncbi:hypothetical protein BHYA_0205g00170 [Botrytis hyacinthi]|uniref:Uncharacterized protein n=1 Tax=Botrytis hyacinthi TaxID=278943 RepID=A0A4Z1GBU3_9HELO|nr:hypothetical protein BHYA_0205g00170 [Botrytis hyacinthi]
MLELLFYKHLVDADLTPDFSARFGAEIKKFTFDRLFSKNIMSQILDPLIPTRTTNNMMQIMHDKPAFQLRERRSQRDSLLTIPSSHIHPQSRDRTIALSQKPTHGEEILHQRGSLRPVCTAVFCGSVGFLYFVSARNPGKAKYAGPRKSALRNLELAFASSRGG